MLLSVGHGLDIFASAFTSSTLLSLHNSFSCDQHLISNAFWRSQGTVTAIPSGPNPVIVDYSWSKEYVGSTRTRSIRLGDDDLRIPPILCSALVTEQNNSHLLLGCADGAHIILMENDDFICFQHSGSPIQALSVTPDGQKFCSGCSDGSILITAWSNRQKPKLVSTLNGGLNLRNSKVTALAQPVDSSTHVLLRLASGHIDGRLKLWSVPRSAIVSDFAAHEQSAVSDVCFLSQDSNKILSVGLDKTICLTSMLSKSVEKKVKTGHPLTSVTVSASGGTIAVGTVESQILVYDVRALDNPLQTLQTGVGHVRAVRFTPERMHAERKNTYNVSSPTQLPLPVSSPPSDSGSSSVFGRTPERTPQTASLFCQTFSSINSTIDDIPPTSSHPSLHIPSVSSLDSVLHPSHKYQRSYLHDSIFSDIDTSHCTDSLDRNYHRTSTALRPSGSAQPNNTDTCSLSKIRSPLGFYDSPIVSAQREEDAAKATIGGVNERSEGATSAPKIRLNSAMLNEEKENIHPASSSISASASSSQFTANSKIRSPPSSHIVSTDCASCPTATNCLDMSRSHLSNSNRIHSSAAISQPSSTGAASDVHVQAEDDAAHIQDQQPQQQDLALDHLAQPPAAEVSVNAAPHNALGQIGPRYPGEPVFDLFGLSYAVHEIEEALEVYRARLQIDDIYPVFMELVRYRIAADERMDALTSEVASLRSEMQQQREELETLRMCLLD